MHLLLKGVMIVLFILYYYVEELVKLFIPKKKKSLRGEIVLITGAAHGLGRETAHAFSKHQCKLVLWDINKHGTEETAEECRKLGAVVHTYVVDCRKREEIYRTADEVKKDIGDISILINNAGVITTGHLLSLTDEQIQNMFDINILAHYWTVKAFLPAMMERNHGHIVTVASSAGFLPSPFMVAYASSKHGIIGFHQSLTEELYLLQKDGIKTSCLCPNFINNGFVKNLPTKIISPLETEYVANKLMEGILTNQKMIIVPLPVKLVVIIFRWSFIILAPQPRGPSLGLPHIYPQKVGAFEPGHQRITVVVGLLPERVYRFFEAIEQEWIDSYKNQFQKSKAKNPPSA